MICPMSHGAFKVVPLLYSIINNPKIKSLFSAGQASLLFLCFSLYFAQGCSTYIIKLLAVQVVVLCGFFSFSYDVFQFP